MTPFEQFERDHVRARPGSTLIVGSKVYPGREDRSCRYINAIGVDIEEGEGVDIVADMTLNSEGHGAQNVAFYGPFAHVECLSVLEHTPAPWKMAANIEDLMLPGATLFVAAPFVHRVHNYPHDLWRFTPQAMPILFPRIEWRAVMIAERELVPGPKVKAIKSGGHPYLPRAEVLAFGVRK